MTSMMLSNMYDNQSLISKNFQTTCEPNFYAKKSQLNNMATDATDKILNTINSLAKETNALKEEELVNLFEYLIDKNTNKFDVEKFLMSCSSNNAKLLYLRVLSKKSGTNLQVKQNHGEERMGYNR
jgi:hypothetical protein